MPKSKYAERGKVKPKSIKAKVKLSSKRKLSRFGAFAAVVLHMAAASACLRPRVETGMRAPLLLLPRLLRRLTADSGV